MSAQILTTWAADQQIAANERWWRRHRDAKGLFRSELRRAFALLAEQPDVGRRVRLGSFRPRRVLMPKTRFHVYYDHNAETNTVLVFAVHGAMRGRGPKGLGR